MNAMRPTLCAFCLVLLAAGPALAEEAPLAASAWVAQAIPETPAPEGEAKRAEPAFPPAANAETAEEAAAMPIAEEEDSGSGGPYGGILSIGQQLDSAGGSLPDKAPDTSLRLRFDRIELERLYQAVRDAAKTERRRISLRECIAMALENNQDILIAEYGPLKSDADLMSAWGQYDPILGGQVSYQEARQTTSGETLVFSGGISSVVVDRMNSQLSLNGMAPWSGTQYNVALDLGRDRTTYTAFEPDWSGGLNLTLTQPLLRGFGPNATLASIRTAKKSRLQANDQLEIQIANSLAEVVKAYWDLVGAYENVRVREESLANAERLLEQNERRHELGALSGLEVVQAKAGVATRQSDLISARSQVHDAADQLKNLMSLGEGVRLADAVLVPVERPSLEETGLDEERSIQLAMSHRPEVRTAEISIETAEIERKRAANDMLPQIDLTGTYNRGGRGGEHQEVFRGIRDRQDSVWSVGVQGQVPLGNRQARGSYRRRQLEVREAEQRLAKTQQDIVLNVRFAMRQAATSRILVESNRQARALQETNVAAEEKRQKLGASTSFEVLRTQEDLTQAQVNEVQSVITYEKAVVDLRLAEGVLLDELGIEFEPPEKDESISFARSIVPFIEK